MLVMMMMITILMVMIMILMSILNLILLIILKLLVNIQLTEQIGGGRRADIRTDGFNHQNDIIKEIILLMTA